jgi:hypothetical protein
LSVRVVYVGAQAAPVFLDFLAGVAGFVSDLSDLSDFIDDDSFEEVDSEDELLLESLEEDDDAPGLGPA